MAILGTFRLQVPFMVASAIALRINTPASRTRRMADRASLPTSCSVVSLIRCRHLCRHPVGTKMVDGIAASVISAVPDWMGPLHGHRG